MLVWCIYMCPVSCIIVVMFMYLYISEKPPRKQEILGWNLNRRHNQSDTELGVTTRCMLVRRGQDGVQSMPRTRPWMTYSQGAIRRPLFKYVHWQLCIVTLYLHVFTMMIACSIIWYSAICLKSFSHIGNLIHNANWCLFSQVKNKP